MFHYFYISFLHDQRVVGCGGKMNGEESIQRWRTKEKSNGEAWWEIRLNIEQCVELTSSECLGESKEAEEKMFWAGDAGAETWKKQEQGCKWERWARREREMFAWEKFLLTWIWLCCSALFKEEKSFSVVSSGFSLWCSYKFQLNVIRSSAALYRMECIERSSRGGEVCV